MQVHVSRAGRFEQVVSILSNQNRTMTTHEIVKKMGMKYGQHSRGIVYAAYNAGLIHGWQSVKPNGKPVYYWQSLERYVLQPTQQALPL